jgi:hypothetical protein
LPELGTGPTGVTNSSVTANVTARGGGSTALRVTNPYCRIAEPYRTEFKGLATYTIPKVDVLGGTWINIPGDSLAANFVATNAYIAAGPQPSVRSLEDLKRDGEPDPPATLYSDRRNNIDFRIADHRATDASLIGVDIYNLTNTDVATDSTRHVADYARG